MSEVPAQRTAPTKVASNGDQLARRNALILSAAQALSGANASIVIATGGLVGYYLLDSDKSLATVPITAFVTGTAAGAIPAAMLMRRIGRRPGFVLASLVAIGGGYLAMQAIFLDDFWLFCLATFLIGITAAFGHQYRFAAADTASDAFRPKAISWVLAGGVAAGVIGPQTVIGMKDYFDPIPFAGAFLGQIGLMILSVAILLFLNIPKPPPVKQTGSGRPISVILRQPRFIIAVLCAITSYALMSLVMTATPLAMVACGHTPADAATAIQWHVIAMFGPSFFTGSLIARFGKERVIAVGLLLLGACAVVALSGLDLANFFLALILLGVGWNFGFIGATAMVTDCYRPEERAKVQAANDFLVFGFVGFASFMSGNLLNAYGWEMVNWTVFPFVVLCFGLLVWLVTTGRAQPAPTS